MAQKYTAFSYKKGNSIIHRMPSWINILFIPLISVLFFVLPVYVSAVLILFQFVLAFCLKFTVREQLADLKPVLVYGILLLIFQIVMSLMDASLSLVESLSFENQKNTIFMLVKLFCIMQSASILFKTSTSLELREGIGLMENRVRKILHLKKTNTFTDAMALFMNFLPMVSKIWDQSVRAWICRGGKKSIKMYLTLLPVLFSVGMKKAWNAARALEIRR